MATTSLPPGTARVIASWNPFCFRSKGMISLSIVCTNSVILFGFKYRETLRTNMSISLWVVAAKRRNFRVRQWRSLNATVCSSLSTVNSSANSFPKPLIAIPNPFGYSRMRTARKNHPPHAACARNCHSARKHHHVPIDGPPPHYEDSAAESPERAYDQGLWRFRSLSPARLANAATPTGGGPFRPPRLSLLNSS